MTAPLIVRAALVVAAVSAVLLLVGWQHSDGACTDSVKAMFVALKERAPGPRIDATLDDIEDDCDGTSRLVDSGGVLFREGHAQRAARLLREAVELEPESFSAWAGLASVLFRGDPAGAAAAAARASRLNPYYRPPS